MISKAEQQKAFEEVYGALNAEQKLAVDTIDGPVMVIAGPGTGKTQILGARIGKILIETDTAPENILCLTYTDAGAIAMRKRLVGFIGASAYKVNISTFHSFCNDIIQDNLSLFDKPSLDPISELEKIELLKKLIDKFDKNNPLKRYRGDVYYEMNNLSRLFSAMKKEGWTSTYLVEQIDRYIAEIPTRDEFVYKKKYKQFEAGDLKQGLVDDAIEKMGAVVLRGDHYLQTSGVRHGQLNGITIDCTTIPDAAMTLAIMALFAKGKTRLEKIASWRVKETDRIAAMAKELRKLGAIVIEGADFIEIEPLEQQDWQSPADGIDTYDDHRMAMCFSLSAFGPKSIQINDPNCVAKTFPHYFSELASITY